MEPVDIPPFQLEIIRKEAALAAMKEDAKAKQRAFMAGVLVGLSPVIALLPDWESIWRTPTFAGLAFGVLGGTFAAVYVDRHTWKRIEDALAKGGGKERGK